jgi:hypothetical protein
VDGFSLLLGARAGSCCENGAGEVLDVALSLLLQQCAIIVYDKLFGDNALLALSFGLAPSGGIYMQFERGKPPETPNAPYRTARIKYERCRSAGPGFAPGRVGSWLSFRSSQDQKLSMGRLGVEL